MNRANMKILHETSSNSQIGKYVEITNPQHEAFGEWGIIKDYNLEDAEYFICIAGDSSCLLFNSDEFKIINAKFLK